MSSHLQDGRTVIANSTKPKPSAQAAKATGYYLWRAANLWVHHLELALRDLGLSHSQYVVLSGVRHLSAKGKGKGESVSQNRIASEKGVNVNVVSQVARLLESRGLLQRHPSPRDTRAKNLELTPAGEALLVQARRRAGRASRTFFAEMEDGDAMQNQLKRLVDAQG